MIAERQSDTEYKPLLTDDDIDAKNAEGSEMSSIFTGLTFPEVPKTQIIPIIRQNPPRTNIEDYIEFTDSSEANIILGVFLFCNPYSHIINLSSPIKL